MSCLHGVLGLPAERTVRLLWCRMLLSGKGLADCDPCHGVCQIAEVLPVKCVRAELPDDVACTVDNGAAPVRIAVQTATAPPAVEHMRFVIFLVPYRECVSVQKTCFGSVAFLRHDGRDTALPEQVLHHPDEQRERNLCEVLAVGVPVPDAADHVLCVPDEDSVNPVFRGIPEQEMSDPGSGRPMLFAPARKFMTPVSTHKDRDASFSKVRCR